MDRKMSARKESSTPEAVFHLMMIPKQQLQLSSPLAWQPLSAASIQCVLMVAESFWHQSRSRSLRVRKLSIETRKKCKEKFLEE